MSETKLWEELNTIMEPYWHASRVESHATSAGIPDVDYCYFGDGHVELKFGWTNKQMPKIRDSQVRWIAKRASKGGKVLMLTKLIDGVDEVYLFHRGQSVLSLNSNRKYEYWFNNRINDNYWTLDTEELRDILRGER